jgi:hypothetical protein
VKTFSNGKIDPLALKRLETYTRSPETGEVGVETHPDGHVLLVELAEKR